MEFMVSGQGEYLYGPLAFYHTRAASLVGVVLLDETEADGRAGPYFDADPGAAVPVPLVPQVRATQEPTPSPGAVAAYLTPPPITPYGDGAPAAPLALPRFMPGASPWVRGLTGMLVLAACVASIALGVWLRRRWRSPARGPVETGETGRSPVQTGQGSTQAGQGPAQTGHRGEQSGEGHAQTGTPATGFVTGDGQGGGGASPPPAEGVAG
jgi:hypothetical protein